MKFALQMFSSFLCIILENHGEVVPTLHVIRSSECSPQKNYGNAIYSITKSENEFYIHTSFALNVVAVENTDS